MTNISVIICAYTERRWQDLQEAVASVKQQSLPPKEIIVVIDHNHSLASLSRRELDGVIVVENEKVRGLSGALNRGIEATTSDIIAFLDDDAVADQDWLETLVPHYQEPKVIAVGGKIEPLYLAGRPAWFPEEFDWVVGCTYRGLPETVAAVRNLIGCNMSFRRQVLELTGGFQVDVGRIGKHSMGREDDETEFCIRSSQKIKGSILLYDPQARVRHRVPPERASWRYLFQRCYSEGLSKAKLARLVGAGDGLSSEWSYTLQTLPRGMARGFADFLTRRDMGGIGRIFAIMAGFSATAFGYVVAKAAGFVR